MQATLLLLLALAGVCHSELVGTVILSRHGVRTPYGPNGDDLTKESLTPYTNRDFPIGKEAWGVEGTAQLTPHGKLALERMGEYYASDERYQSILGDNACDKIAIFSDIDDRDQLTAESFLRGLRPDCLGKVDISLRSYKTLFNVGRETSPDCQLASHDIMKTLTGGDERASALMTANMAMVKDINQYVGCCDKSLCGGKEPCDITDLPMKWSHEVFQPFTGPTTQAGYFAEYFLLEGLSNMTIAWGELELSEVVDMYQLKVQDYSLVDNFWAARSFASTLATYILVSLLQMSTNTPVPGAMHGPDTRMLFLAAHDTNILLLRRILNAEWITDGWRLNDPPPGGMLIFELHKNETTGYSVRTFFEAASPEQIRQATRFHPQGSDRPSRTAISLPGCVSSHYTHPKPGLAIDCPLDAFKELILEAVRPTCVQGSELKQFVRDNIDDEDSEPDDDDNVSDLGWALIGAAAGGVTVLVLGLLVIRLRRRRSSPDPLLQDRYINAS